MSKLRSRNAEYNPFAWLYANHWGANFHSQALPALRRLFLNTLEPGSSLLDLCCGDGRLIHELTQAGYRMTGLDSSEQMLRYARRANPGTKFVLGDARHFHLAERFDGVISTFDSLNHVLRREELASVFQNVYECLKGGGFFAFDLNRQQAYVKQWTIPWIKVTSSLVALAQGAYDVETKLAVCEVTQFRRGSSRRARWERSNFVLTQRFHPASEVAASLKAAGFVSIRRVDAAELGMFGDLPLARTFYLARKPEFA